MNSTNKKHIWLYVLKLEQNKFYAGITARHNPIVRIQQHIAGKGARWTKEYPPIEVVELHDLGLTTWKAAKTEEYNHTIEYANKYGIKNVRGASLTYTGEIYRFFGHYYHDYRLSTIVQLVLILLVIIFLGYMALFS